MPTPSSSIAATHPGLRSLVVLNPLSMLAASMFWFGLLLLPLAALKAAEGNWQRATTAGLLSLGLLLLTVRQVAHRNQPMLLTSNRDGLHLEPLGRSETPEHVGFLFGSERFGMRNEDVYRCNVALSIPADPKFGSLNLGAAIQLIAYEWRLALGGFPVTESVAPAEAADARAVAGMLAHWERSLVEIGFLDPAAPKKLMPRLQQLFNRARPTVEEIHILRGIAKAMAQPQRGAPAVTETPPDARAPD